MKKNHYWAIRYPHGHFDPHLSYTRKDAIAKYLAVWDNGKYANWTWRQHKEGHRVAVVKVQVVEI